MIQEKTKRKVKKKAKTAIKVWRTFTSLIIFLILTPTFLHAYDYEHFFTIVLIITALVCGLLIIIKQPMKKKVRRYIDTGMRFILIGALVLILAASIVEPFLLWLQLVLLGLSALFYAFGLQRLGIGYAFGII